MGRFGLVGPSYTSQSPIADCQTCMNWYVENAEDPASKAARMLYPTPGLKLLGAFSEGPSRCLATLNGRLFAVSGTKFYEGFADGSSLALGTVVSDGLPAYIACGPTFLAIASGGHLYSYNLTTGAFVEIDTTSGVALQGRVSQVGFTDGYFIALLSNSNKWQISALENASSWNPLDIAQISVYADNIVSMLIDHREVWFFGLKASVAYYNSGNPFFPFDVIPSSYNEYGCGAAASPSKLDNTDFLLGVNETGGGMGWKINGYRFERITNHAIENEWQGYSTITDAETFAFQYKGHSFWRVNFPTANKTWVFDVATNLWHQCDFWNAGISERHLARTHVFCFGVHLVGDRRNGNIYNLTDAAGDDAGTPIHRVRRAPHISREKKLTSFGQLEIECEVGLGPQPPLLDGNDQARGPRMTLRWSNDGGKTWPGERTMDMGQAGEFKKRVKENRLGQARDRVFEISYSDTAPCRIIDAYLEATPGFAPTERLSEQVRKSA